MDTDGLGVGRALLAGRALVLTVVIVVCGTLAHVSAAGRLPGVMFFLLLSAATALVSAMSLTRPASRRRVVLLSVGGQTWIHLALTAAAGHVGDPSTPRRTPPLTAPGPGGGARPPTYLEVYESTRPVVPDDGPTVPSPLVHLAAELSGDQAPMMLLHLVAAALVGLWLAAGERALWALLSALLGVRTSVVVAAGPVPARPQPVLLDGLPVPRCRPTALPALRRGPPLLAA